MLAAEEHAVSIDAHTATPIVETEIFDRTELRDARVVDEHGESAERLTREGDRGNPVALVRDIVPKGESRSRAQFRIDLRGLFPHPLDIDVGEQYPGSLASEHVRAGGADALRGAGDERGLAAYPRAHGRSLGRGQRPPSDHASDSSSGSGS